MNTGQNLISGLPTVNSIRPHGWLYRGWEGGVVMALKRVQLQGTLALGSFRDCCRLTMLHWPRLVTTKAVSLLIIIDS